MFLSMRNPSFTSNFIKPIFRILPTCLCLIDVRRNERENAEYGACWGTERNEDGLFVNSGAWRHASCKLAGDWLVGLTLQLQSKQLEQANTHTHSLWHTQAGIQMRDCLSHTVFISHTFNFLPWDETCALETSLHLCSLPLSAPSHHRG